MWRQFWSDSRGKVIIILLLVWIAAIFHEFSLNKAVNPIVSVAAIVIIDWFITRLRNGNNFFSLSSIVTGLLIGLILDPDGSIWLIFFADIFAVLDKQFLRTRIHRHIFNPAAFGLLISAQLFNGNVAWWAVSWGIWPTLIIGLGMIYVLWLLRRLLLPITFLAIYFLINLPSVGSIESLRLIFDGTVFLFAFIMIPEPMTSRARGVWQYLWGTLVGLVLFLLIKSPLQIIDPLLAALLITNMIGFTWVDLITPKFLSGKVSDFPLR